MKQSIFTFILLTMITTSAVPAQNPPLDFEKVKAFEHQLDDIMELIDTNVVVSKLKQAETDFRDSPGTLNQARLGIVCHEVSLNLYFMAADKSTSAWRGYAQKSYDLLSELYDSDSTALELLPFVAAYRASAMALVGGETKNLKLLSLAFDQFALAIERYARVSYLPEFLRGSVAENLPWFFFSKRKAAQNDFQSIIDKQRENESYANGKIMSFTYWAWANQHSKKKYRTQALKYLNLAIALDPEYRAGRKRAEELIATWGR